MPALIVRTGPKAGFNYDLLPSRSRVRLGRLGSNQLQILDKKASREHAEIVLEGEVYVIRDLGSRNGTFVNGARLEEAHALKPGDRISIGDFVLDYRDEVVDEIEDAEELASVELVEDAEGLADADGLEVLGPADVVDNDVVKDDEKPEEVEEAEEADEAEEAEEVEEVEEVEEAGEAGEAAPAEAASESDAETDDEIDDGIDDAPPDVEDIVEIEPRKIAAEPADAGGVEVLGPADLAGDDEDAEEPEEFAAIESVDSVDSVDSVAGLEVLGPEDLADEDDD